MSDELFKFEYGLSRKIRYCGKRSNFFDALHRLTLFINAVSGSAAFVSIIAAQTVLAATLAAIVAIVSASDNVIGYSERARLYNSLRMRYYDIYCDFIGRERSRINVLKFKEKRLLVDRDAPPPKKVLDIISRNEEDISRGFPVEDTIYIAWHRYFLRHVIDLPPARWKTIQQEKGHVSPPGEKKAPPDEAKAQSQAAAPNLVAQPRRPLKPVKPAGPVQAKARQTIKMPKSASGVESSTPSKRAKARESAAAKRASRREG